MATTYYKPPAGRVQQGGYKATPVAPVKPYYTPPAGRIEQGGYAVPPALANTATRAAQPAAPSTAPAAAAQPPAAPAAPKQTANPYDFSNDYSLQTILAYDTKARNDAEAQANMLRNQLAIQFGDASGFSTDENTAAAAKGNTFSTLAQLARGYKTDQTATDESYNKRNLFFSGHRGKALGDLATGYQQKQYDARLAALGQLNTISQNLADALQNSGWQDAQAWSQAYTVASQLAQQYGVDPGAGQNQAAAPAAPDVPAPVAPVPLGMNGQPVDATTQGLLAGLSQLAQAGWMG